MPELPEVETTRRSFAQRIAGATVTDVRLGKPLRWPLGCTPASLRGRRVGQATRRGKYLWLPVGEGLVRYRGFIPRQADITIIAERPRLGSYFPAKAEALSRATGIPVTSLGLKAKTNEGMGFVGRGEGIAVIAVATLESS